MGEGGDGEADWGMDSDGTGDTVMDGGEERGAPGDPPSDSREFEEDGGHHHKDNIEVACGQTAREDNCNCRHMHFLIGSYPRVGIQRIDKLDDATSGILGDQAVFDKDLKTLRLLRGDHEAKLEKVLLQQQGLVDKMIRYLETGEDKMRELVRRGGVPNQPATASCPESLLRPVTTLRTAAEGVTPMKGPMEAAPYCPPRVDPSLFRHIPLFSASVTLRENKPEKGSGIGTPELDTREEKVDICMSSPPAAATFDAHAAYAARVDKEPLKSAARRDESSGESWDQDPRSGIWTMDGRSHIQTARRLADPSSTISPGQALGMVEVPDLGAPLLLILGMLYASKISRT